MERSPHEHYELLLADAVQECGPISPETLTGIVGFSGGGLVSMCRLGSGQTHVTCELSLNGDQHYSEEGMRFELLSRMNLSEFDVQKILTCIGALSLEEKLGDGHTVDIAAVSPSKEVQTVRLSLYSACQIGGTKFGVYEVSSVAANVA